MNTRTYKLAADFFLWVHILSILIFLVGGILLFFYKNLALYYFIAVILAVLIRIPFKGCPLTVWEIRLRKLYDPKVKYYDNSCIATYINKVPGIKLRPKTANLILNLVTGFFILITVLILTRVL